MSSEVFSNLIQPIIALVLGGGVGSIISIRYANQKAKAEAEHEAANADSVRIESTQKIIAANDLILEKSERLHKMREDDLLNKQSEYEIQISSYKEELIVQRNEFKEEISNMRSEYEKQISTMKAEYENQLNEYKQELVSLKNEISEKTAIIASLTKDLSRISALVSDKLNEIEDKEK